MVFGRVKTVESKNGNTPDRLFAAKGVLAFPGRERELLMQDRSCT